MSDRLPTPKEIYEARARLDVAIGVAWGLYYTEDTTPEAAEVLRKTFIEQLQAAARVLGLELVERHPQKSQADVLCDLLTQVGAKVVDVTEGGPR